MNSPTIFCFRSKLQTNMIFLPTFTGNYLCNRLDQNQPLEMKVYFASLNPAGSNHPVFIRIAIVQSSGREKFAGAMVALFESGQIKGIPEVLRQHVVSSDRFVVLSITVSEKLLTISLISMMFFWQKGPLIMRSN